MRSRLAFKSAFLLLARGRDRLETKLALFGSVIGVLLLLARGRDQLGTSMFFHFQGFFFKFATR
ncbi:hypothetical protein [Pseudanabaena sp. Chao 1811]|uniref:hypothetical protein n=1 Tax=Pseudanabaena sp. Chao 1811 TaxID=2963092 RepID=UPI003F914CEF